MCVQSKIYFGKLFGPDSDKILIWMGKIVIKMDDGFLSGGD